MAPRTPHSTTVETLGPSETQDLAACLGAIARTGDRIALNGPLGAGKTQFAKGFARGLGVVDVVNSPSFTLMAEYEGRLPLFHLDLYRLEGVAEAVAGGMLDDRQRGGVTLTEWPERLGEELDAARLEVRFVRVDGEERTIELVAAAPRYRPYVDAAAKWSRDRGRALDGASPRSRAAVDEREPVGQGT